MRVRRGRVLDVSITRSIGPSTADSVREKAVVVAQTTASRVRTLDTDSNCGFCAQELFIVREDASFFDELESFLNDSAILGEDTDLDEGEQAYEDERISSVALAESDTSQAGDAIAAFTEHMEVARKSNEELEVALVHVSAVSTYFLKMYTKLLETNAAVAAEL